jgi:energy-coupling factor transporter ATP-binding protein EcfA2
MISSIGLHNFKAFADVEVDLAPITVLVGPNNCGKSSILSAMRLLAQTVDSYDPDVALLLNGSMGDFGTYKDIVFGNLRARPMKLSVSVRPAAGALRLWRPRGPRTTDVLTMQLEYKYRTMRREVILRRVDIEVNGRSLLRTAYSERSEKQLIERIGDAQVPPSVKSAVSDGLRMQNFVPRVRGYRFRYSLSERGAAREFVTKKVSDNAELAGRAAIAIADSLRRVEYIGAMRVPPFRTYRFTGERRRRVGPGGEEAPGILMMDSARGGRRSLGVLESMKHWLSAAGIASDVKIVPLSDRHYEIRVEHPITKEHQNLADVGQGVSQILPVLVAGLHLGEGSVLIVEEPEIHLHPRAQAELGDFFLTLHEKGVQSIIETHSEYLVLRLLQHVASGSISPDQVSLNYVYARGDQKEVKRLHVDSQGRFVDEWPEGFFPERLEEAKELARIRHRKQVSGG